MHRLLVNKYGEKFHFFFRHSCSNGFPLILGAVRTTKAFVIKNANKFTNKKQQNITNESSNYKYHK